MESPGLDEHAMRIWRQPIVGVAFGRALFALRANRAGTPSRPMRVTVADACALRAPGRPLPAPMNRLAAAGRAVALVSKLPNEMPAGTEAPRASFP